MIKKTIFIQYNPHCTFPSVEDMDSYLKYCKKKVRNVIKTLNNNPENIGSAKISVPDPIAAIYIELYAKCLNCDAVYLKQFGDTVDEKDFYRPFAQLLRESELYREEVKAWMNGECNNPLIDVEE